MDYGSIPAMDRQPGDADPISRHQPTTCFYSYLVGRSGTTNEICGVQIQYTGEVEAAARVKLNTGLLATSYGCTSALAGSTTAGPATLATWRILLFAAMKLPSDNLVLV